MVNGSSIASADWRIVSAITFSDLLNRSFSALVALVFSGSARPSSPLSSSTKSFFGSAAIALPHYFIASSRLCGKLFPSSLLKHQLRRPARGLHHRLDQRHAQ